MKTLNWNPLQTTEQVDDLVLRSFSVPCLIFKHSIRCNISAIAKYRLEEDWSFMDEEIEPYYLDLVTYRNVSNHVAEIFSIHHESPQALLIHKGECLYDTSHLDITVEELKEALMTEISH
ncbi:MAG: bacillithiol system redox-active protein YtxJ [Saprospiraceae bacterium]|nr:bacillithiol system redox-active protein YtxJ [Saprospiraceae bacterium]